MSSIKLPTSLLPPERSRIRDNERNEELETPQYSNLNESTDGYVWFSEYLSDNSNKSNSEAASSSSSSSFNTSYSGNTRGGKGGGVEKEGESGSGGGDLESESESESPFYSDMDFPSTTTTPTEVPDGKFMYTHRGFLIPCSLESYRNLYPSTSPADYLKIARSYLEIERSGGMGSGKEHEYEFRMATMRKEYLDVMDQCSKAISEYKKAIETETDAERLNKLWEEYERWKQVVDEYRTKMEELREKETKRKSECQEEEQEEEKLEGYLDTIHGIIKEWMKGQRKNMTTPLL